MLMIRLQRIGRTNSPHFRVVLTDKRNSPKSGRFLEILGSYGAKKGDFKVNGDRVKHWISQGAKVSDTMHNFLITHKITTGKKINVLPSKHPIKRAPIEATGEVGKEVKEAPVVAEATSTSSGQAAPAEAPVA